MLFRSVDERYTNILDPVLYAQLNRICRPLLTSAIFSAMRVYTDQKTGNRAKLDQEVASAWVPLMRRLMPGWSRLGERLFRTRFRELAAGVLRVLTRWGLTPAARNWQAVTYHVPTYSWLVTQARHAIY